MTIKAMAMRTPARLAVLGVLAMAGTLSAEETSTPEGRVKTAAEAALEKLALPSPGQAFYSFTQSDWVSDAVKARRGRAETRDAHGHLPPNQRAELGGVTTISPGTLYVPSDSQWEARTTLTSLDMTSMLFDQEGLAVIADPKSRLLIRTDRKMGVHLVSPVDPRDRSVPGNLARQALYFPATLASIVQTAREVTATGPHSFRVRPAQPTRFIMGHEVDEMTLEFSAPETWAVAIRAAATTNQVYCVAVTARVQTDRIGELTYTQDILDATTKERTHGLTCTLESCTQAESRLTGLTISQALTSLEWSEPVRVVTPPPEPGTRQVPRLPDPKAGDEARPGGRQRE